MLCYPGKTQGRHTAGQRSVFNRLRPDPSPAWISVQQLGGGVFWEKGAFEKPILHGLQLGAITRFKQWLNPIAPGRLSGRHEAAAQALPGSLGISAIVLALPLLFAWGRRPRSVQTRLLEVRARNGVGNVRAHPVSPFFGGWGPRKLRAERVAPAFKDVQDL